MTADIGALFAIPFAVTVIFLGLHTYFGLHVLRRRVVFADLALAQLSALGSTVAVALRHAPGDPAALGYALVFALAGAAALTASRATSRVIGQEAFVGILYVVATATTILVIDRAPQGAEHVKRMLVGTLLDAGPAQLHEIVPLYGAIALLHWVARHPFLRASKGQLGGVSGALWDFVFYASFGALVTSSVAVAGVLVVFSLLIIPAVIGTLFAPARMGRALLIGWGFGLLGSAAAFAASLSLDLPTGACVVLSLFAVLVLAAAGRMFFVGDRGAINSRRAQARTAVGLGALLLVAAGAAWSLAAPASDQPLLAALEAVGLGPERFMSAGEAERYADALSTEQQYLAQLATLSEGERQARWQGTGLTDDDVRRIASYEQTYNEMARGERFVHHHLRNRARARERWFVSLPLAVCASLGVVCFLLRFLARRTLDSGDEGSGEI